MIPLHALVDYVNVHWSSLPQNQTCQHVCNHARPRQCVQPRTTPPMCATLHDPANVCNPARPCQCVQPRTALPSLLLSHSPNKQGSGEATPWVLGEKHTHAHTHDTRIDSHAHTHATPPFACGILQTLQYRSLMIPCRHRNMIHSRGPVHIATPFKYDTLQTVQYVSLMRPHRQRSVYYS